jgi:hypothetical protein
VLVLTLSRGKGKGYPHQTGSPLPFVLAILAQAKFSSKPPKQSRLPHTGRLLIRPEFAAPLRTAVSSCPIILKTVETSPVSQAYCNATL